MGHRAIEIKTTYLDLVTAATEKKSVTHYHAVKPSKNGPEQVFCFGTKIPPIWLPLHY